MGPGDDAAVISNGLTCSIDTLVEGVHFDHRLSPADVGYKTVAVSVSDLAAMGCRPEWMMLSLSLPESSTMDWINQFTIGLHEALSEYAVCLVGGDTTRTTGPIVVSGSMLGMTQADALLRSGSKAGDHIWATGWLGLAGAGYKMINPPDEALAALRRPTPPVEFALALHAQGLASSAMDISDGLSTDLRRLVAASGLGALINEESIEVHPSIAHAQGLLSLQVDAGDDYQLLFTASPKHELEIRRTAAQNDTKVQKIGVTTVKDSVELSSHQWPGTEFAHFAKASN